MRLKPLVALSAVLLLAGCYDPDNGPPPASDDIALVEPADGDAVILANGKNISITLESNPTTGYFWHYTMEPDGFLTELSADYIGDPAPEGITGSGGRQVFVFAANTAGDGALTFSYERSPEDVFETRNISIAIK